MKVIALGGYPEMRALCHQVKEGEIKALEKAANLMAEHITKDDVLIPIPGRFGRALYTLSLAIRIAYKTGCKVENCLKGEKRPSLCDLKKEGLPLEVPVFTRGYSVPEGVRYILIDNVYDTGMTAEAARKALRRKCKVLVIAVTANKKN